MSRPRLAPSAVRTTISDSRVAARANISSATLPLTSSTSSAMTTFIDASSVRSSGFAHVRQGAGWTSATRCACVAGQSAAACALSTASSALACSGVTPGFIRAQIVIPMPARGFTALR